MVRAVRWKLHSRRTKGERIRDRKSIILHDVSISEKTQTRYFWALNKLLPFITAVHSLLDLDEAITNWIQRSFERGEPLHLISDALCGLQHQEPWVKRNIPMAWKLFGVWRKLESPGRAPPLTKDIIYSWANYAIEHHDIIFASLVLIGFFALLRTGELLQVCAKDLLIDDTNGIVTLYGTKTGQRDNVGEMVSFDDFLTIETLRTVQQIQKERQLYNVPLWHRSAQCFRSQFQRYCDRFDLLQHQFRPYSLRRGGATWIFQKTGSMEVALVKGRWSSNRVARIYISDALSYLPGLTFTEAARRTLKFWSPFST